MTLDVMKNLCAKTRPVSNPYEVWTNGSWTWKVLKKYQANDDKLFARWFCMVTSPYCPEGEMGDTYVAEIKSNAYRVDTEAKSFGGAMLRAALNSKNI
jgi:hypothetical protein